MNAVGRSILGNALFVAAVLFTGTALAAGSITIIATKDGAVLPSGSGNKLVYNVMLSPEGNHLHVYIDDDNPIIDHQVSGCPCTLDLPDLAPGKHVIAVKEATVSHVLTGVQAQVTVRVR